MGQVEAILFHLARNSPKQHAYSPKYHADSPKTVRNTSKGPKCPDRHGSLQQFLHEREHFAVHLSD